MASKRSKQLDQKYVSRAEFNNMAGSKDLRVAASGLQTAFRSVCVGLFGKRFYDRLSASADRKNRSPLGYALDVLFK